MPGAGRAASGLNVSSNPVRGRADIRFQLSEQGRVTLSIRDVAGRTVAVVADGVMNPGEYRRDWVVAPTVPAGIYFVSLKTPVSSETRKLILTVSSAASTAQRQSNTSAERESKSRRRSHG